MSHKDGRVVLSAWVEPVLRDYAREGLAPANTQQTASSPSREKTLVEVFEFDALSPEQRQEHLRQAALALGLDNPKESP